ncbi:acyltransferase family protein [Paractinoplanes globisporus]|uniref:Acyltransferase family protein n=1 Tax=Paractinoplanes globisporus TaxID=113565 RepID=A0ABW6WBF3_9ACTN|nr:acyltransferase [Actinoplanes globisporus]
MTSSPVLSADLSPAAVPDPAAKPAGTRLDSLTGLRWFAALLVFCLHFSYENNWYGHAHEDDTLQYVFRGASSAVSFFFILSGFVLTWSARPVVGKGRFWWRRFAKIYPSHFVTFLFAVYLVQKLGTHPTVPTVAANLTLTQAWVPDSREYWFSFNGVSWSLSCEFFFYFMFPFVLPWFRRLSVRGLWLFIGVATLVLIVAPLSSPWLTSWLGVRPSYVFYMLPATRLAEFAIGIAVALLVKQDKWRGPGMTAGIALAFVSLFVLAQRVPEPMIYVACTLVPFILIIAAAARADVRGSFSVFRQRHLVYLGEVSFAFYMVHEMVIFGSNYVMRFNHNLSVTETALAVFSVALVLAIALHEFVEKPCMGWLVHKRARRA